MQAVSLCCALYGLTRLLHVFSGPPDSVASGRRGGKCHKQTPDYHFCQMLHGIPLNCRSVVFNPCPIRSVLMAVHGMYAVGTAAAIGLLPIADYPKAYDLPMCRSREVEPQTMRRRPGAGRFCPEVACRGLQTIPATASLCRSEAVAGL